MVIETDERNPTRWIFIQNHSEKKGNYPMLKSIITAAGITSFIIIGAVGTVTLSSEPAFAKRPGEVTVGKRKAGRLFRKCVDSGDGWTKTGKTYDRCCSKSLGYCIKCKFDNKGCVKSPYLISIPGNELDAPTGDVVAPTEDKPSRPLPGSGGLSAPVDDVVAPTEDKPKRWPGKLQMQDNSTGNVVE